MSLVGITLGESSTGIADTLGAATRVLDATPVFMEPHVWVSEYETCDRCNYSEHRCHFCGEDLDHESFAPGGKRHWLSDCRPDLIEHEEGPLCTWPAFEGEYSYLNEELGRPSCYAFQDRDGNRLEAHTHFYSDGPMA